MNQFTTHYYVLSLYTELSFKTLMYQKVTELLNKSQTAAALTHPDMTLLK